MAYSNNGQTMIPLDRRQRRQRRATTVCPAGAIPLMATTPGDSSDAASTSNGIPVTISAEDTTVATTVGLYAVNTTLVYVTTPSSVPYGSYAVILAADSREPRKARIRRELQPALSLYWTMVRRWLPTCRAGIPAMQCCTKAQQTRPRPHSHLRRALDYSRELCGRCKLYGSRHQLRRSTSL